MKRNHTYEINLINKTVVVSKKFMEKATQYGSKEFKLLDNFQKMGLRIINQTRTKKAAKPEEGKLPLLTYKMMRDYLAMLDDADDMLMMFDTLRAGYKSDAKRLVKMNEWFHAECPRYGSVPKFDNNFRITHDPNPVSTTNPIASIA